MLCVKKIFHNDLMQLALIMSLLRLDYILYLNPTQERQQNTTSEYINTKNLDHILLNYERQLFDDLNSLGRYNPLGRRHAFQNISAYLLNVERDITQSIQEEEPEENAHGVTQEIDDFVQSPSNPLLMGDPFFRSDDVDDTAIKLEKFEDSDSASFLNDLGVEEDTFLDNFHDNLLFSNVAVPKIEEDVPDNIFAESLSLDDVAGSLVGELTQEDMDLIEVLWKQDVDLGFSLESEDVKVDPQLLEKALKAKESEKPTDEKVGPIENEACLKTERPDEELADPWNGLQYTIDTETGEYVLKSGSESTPPSSTCDIPLEDLDTLPLTLPDLLFEESFDEEQQKELYDSDIRDTSSPLLTFESESLPIDPPTDEDDFLTMIQTAQLHSSHPHSFAQHPMNPYMRMNEQRWQDVAGLLDNTTSNATSYVALHHPYHIPHHHMAYGGTPEHHHHHHHHHHHQTFPNGTNLGSAVATSINLTGTSESIDSGAGASNYKMESPHDIMYFPNTSSEISNATDGFLSSILNDEDLQLMDMMGGNTEGGMYPIRMMDNNTLANTSSSRHNFDNLGSFSANAERMDASSDSAVSSMGSERIASLSDNEWGDATSDSGHNADYSPILDYANPNKYRPYDYQSYPQRPIEPNRVAQKKHQMFGKRFFQEGTYSNLPTPPKPLAKCGLEHPLYTPRSTLDHVHHNHTYNLPPESTATLQRPLFRDKGKGKSEDEPHLTRDEKRARALNVPLSVDDIINLPMDEFNERLSKFDLSEPQLSLIRDIRRRGKNKVAAQNCRKRKLDQILSLADEVKDMRDRKNRLMAEREFMVNERQRVKDKFTQLYRHVLRNLRDPDGNPYSPNLYSLQQSADGTVIIVPKGNLTEPTKDKKPPQ